MAALRLRVSCLAHLATVNASIGKTTLAVFDPSASEGQALNLVESKDNKDVFDNTRIFRGSHLRVHGARSSFLQFAAVKKTRQTAKTERRKLLQTISSVRALNALPKICRGYGFEFCAPGFDPVLQPFRGRRHVLKNAQAPQQRDPS